MNNLLQLPRLMIASKVLGRMSDEEFIHFTQEQRDLRIERNEKGEIEIMAPTFSETGRINAEIVRQLSNWNVSTKLGFVFDSSAGFRIDPTKEVVRSPDAAFIRKERYAALSPTDKKNFVPLCPDFVIELRSHSDSLSRLQKKMKNYIAYGASLGWLFDTENETVYIYHADGSRDVHKGYSGNLSAGEVLPGFALELDMLKTE
ncbi:MAG: Uma2 family endonuclease [Bacteroidia bacterium]|nr:Uma2 family endonuclease [Bacteroidia bacterium]